MTYHSPFTKEIQTTTLPEAFTMPQIPQYSGTTDPSEHAELYRDQMLIKGIDENAMCRMFTHTLTGPAKSWFRLLKAGSIWKPTYADTFWEKFVVGQAMVFFSKEASTFI